METFIKIFRSNNVPRDGYYYPRAYEVIYQLLNTDTEQCPHPDIYVMQTNGYRCLCTLCGKNTN